MRRIIRANLPIIREVVESEDVLTLSSLLHPLLSKLHSSFTRGMLGKLCSDNDSFNSLKVLKFFLRNQNLAEVNDFPPFERL